MATMDSVGLMFLLICVAGFMPPGVATAPNITSVGDKEELVINTGEDINLICESSGPISWVLQTDDNSTVQIDNRIRENPTIGHISTLHLPQARHFHTGYFRCYDQNNEESEDSVYIYVRDPTYPFVQSDDLIYLPVHQYQSAVFDCRPNAPNINVTLTTTYGDQIALGENQEDGTELLYDPKIGFTMRYVNSRNGGLYTCGTEGHELMILLQVLPHSDFIAKPKISSDQEPHPTVGNNLTLTCRVRSEFETTFSMDWELPPASRAVQEGRVILYNASAYSHEKMGIMTITGTRNVTILNLTNQDEGTYLCRVEDHAGNKNNSSMVIVVQEPVQRT